MTFHDYLLWIIGLGVLDLWLLRAVVGLIGTTLEPPTPLSLYSHLVTTFSDRLQFLWRYVGDHVFFDRPVPVYITCIYNRSSRSNFYSSLQRVHHALKHTTPIRLSDRSISFRVP